MGKKSHTTSRVVMFVAFPIFALTGLCGCHDWPDERVTAIEAQNILRELGQIETVPDPNLEGPAIYKSPPLKLKQSVGGAEEWKLVYFCQYHTAEEMKQIITDQFANKIFDEKGKGISVTDYTVTASPATNQLIVRCPREPDIDAVMEIIRATDIQPIQVRIDCMVSELYADLTVDRETSMLIGNLFGEGVTLGGREDNANLAFPGAALRDPARAKFGLKIGISGDNYKAMVDILVSRGYMKILMNPKLEIVNGQSAKIQSKQHVPLQQIVLRYGPTADALIETKTEYYDVIDSLEITPHVFADGYIGLQTTAQIAAYLTPEGIKQTPIVTERVITNKENRIRLGESLIIGGIRKSEKRDVVRGVPILKDIPLVNLLFSGRDFEERATEVIFILTPSISNGGTPNQDVVETMRQRHSSPITQSFQEKVMDPLGTKARAEEQQRRLDAAREARRKYEAEATMTRLESLEAGRQIEELQAELREAQVKVEQIGTQADQAASKAEHAQTEAEKAATETGQAREKATLVQTEVEETRIESAPVQKTDRPAKPPQPREASDKPASPEPAELPKAGDPPTETGKAREQNQG